MTLPADDGLYINETEPGLVAVFIGIDGYRDRNMEALTCAVNDAIGLSETLRKVWSGRRTHVKILLWPNDRGFAKKTKTSKKTLFGITLPEKAYGVTKEGIISAVQTAALNARAIDTFLFFFAGHGRIINGKLSLLTIKDGATGDGTDDLFVSEIQDAVKRQCNAKLIILDCCLESEDDSDEFQGQLGNQAHDWSIFLSCSPGEGSREDDNKKGDYLQQGIFTASLIDGLRGEAAVTKEGSISLLELVLYVSNRVQSESSVRREDDYLRTQHPVVIANRIALGGQNSIVLAPEYVPLTYKTTRHFPSREFLKFLGAFLFDKSPLKINQIHTFRELGGGLYALIIFLTFLGWSLTVDNISILKVLFSLGVAGVSFLLWWFMVPLLISANEDRWFYGGYIPLAAFIVWHFSLFLILILPKSGVASGSIPLVGIELFLIMGGVIFYGCNTLQSIIVFSEPFRDDERREMRQAMRIFLQFRNRMLNVDAANLIPLLSARPDFYVGVTFLAVALIIFDGSCFILSLVNPSLTNPLVAFKTTSLVKEIAILQDGALLIFVLVQLLWYTSAYHSLRKIFY
jgi:hypothetical protein